MREVILDTETTGLNPRDGHRVVEIGCIELFDREQTGEYFSCHINPERESDADAFAVHKLTTEFLSHHPVFAGVVDAFLKFVGDSPLVIHNVDFDLGFINSELKRLERPKLSRSRGICTVALARRVLPGHSAKLDFLCRHFNIDLSERQQAHSALTDSILLVQVYINLIRLQREAS